MQQVLKHDELNKRLINIDGDFQKMESGSKINPFRIYMNITPRSDSPYSRTATKKEVIKVMVINEDTPSGIKEVSVDNNTSKVVYLLNGQQSTVNGIKHGDVYIMNGKKYLKR